MTTINDYFSKASNGTAPVVSALLAQKAISAGSLSLTLATGWPTTTPVHFLLYKIDTSNALVPGSVTLWKGILSGTTVSNLTLKSGSDDVYPAGSVVELAFTSAQLDDLITGILTSFNQDGTLVTNIPLNAPVVTSPTYVGTVDGWIGANEAWTFASSTTITVPSNATTKYDVGDYIKITQSATVKYFVVTTVAATLLTVSGLAGVTVANSAISANAYSKTRLPHGISLNGGAGYVPYKFRASMNGAANTGNNAFSGAIPFDTEQFDTGSNHSTGVFTAPVAGFYQFNWNAVATLSAGADESFMVSLFKNGSEYSRGSEISYRNLEGSHGSDLVQAATNDTFDIRAFAPTVRALQVGVTSVTYFSGFLVSAL